MSIYIDKAHLYCDHENCDHNLVIAPEELGSYDFGSHSEYDSMESAVADFAFSQQWYIDPITKRVSCAFHDC